GRPRQRRHDAGALELAHMAPDRLRRRRDGVRELVQGRIRATGQLPHDAEANGVGDRLQPRHAEMVTSLVILRKPCETLCSNRYFVWISMIAYTIAPRHAASASAVRTPNHAASAPRPTPQRTADSRRAAPAPTTPPEITCVVDSG